jgi:hypothetical protein
MSEYVAKIEKMVNGYTVEIRDPKIEAANRSPTTPWKNPWKEYVFANSDEVIAFLTKVLGKIKPPEGDDLATNFKRATEEET